MSELTITRSGHVAVFEIHRPPANYFDAELLADIADHAAQEQAGTETRAIVLCSQGKHFCAGANFGADALGQDKRNEAAAQIYREGIRLFEIEIPIVAAVQGSAVGGGLGLACAADFRIASSASRFHANFASLGFHHGFALSVSLPRIIGHQRALELLLGSRRIDGTEAAALGLVDRLCEVGDERRAAIAFAEELAAAAPLAVRAIKRTMKSDVAAAARAALKHELAEQQRLWATKDSAIGIAASLARETPQFVGE
jgi:enoyl-CoA hydratase/carnithine racemase